MKHLGFKHLTRHGTHQPALDGFAAHLLDRSCFDNHLLATASGIAFSTYKLYYSIIGWVYTSNLHLHEPKI